MAKAHGRPGSPLARNQAAIDLATRWGFTDEAHHLHWLVDQMLRVLAGDQYVRIVAEHQAGEDGPNTYTWDVGIPP